MQQRRAATITAANDVGFLDRLDRLERCKAGVSRPNTDEPNSCHASTIGAQAQAGRDGVIAGGNRNRLELSRYHVVGEERQCADGLTAVE